MAQFDLDNFLPYQLAVLASRVSADFAKIYRTKYDIGVAEWRIIAHLSQTSSAISVRDLCVKVELEKSKVSRAATRLAKLGYVDKVTSAVDRRR